MGLDITAYERVYPYAPATDTERAILECDGGDQMMIVYEDDRPLFAYPIQRFYPSDDFPNHAGTIRRGFYRVAGTVFGFRAGSYSGYSHWRSQLGEFVTHLVAHKHAEPFAELINFSDCEGVIGPELCAKLEAEFKAHVEEAKDWSTHRPDGEYWFDRYMKWTRAFEVGSETGCVEFH